MSTVTGLLIFLAAGWLLVRRAGLGRGDLVYDASLGWFIGSGYFALAYVIAIAMRCPVHPLVSLAIISLPFLASLKNGAGDLRAFRASAGGSYGALRGSTRALLPGAPLISLAVIAITIMTLQGVSTPPVADDTVRWRLAVPIRQHFDQAVGFSDSVSNGVWANYVPQLFWHIGGVNVFTLQYLVIFTVIFFLLLIFQSLVLEKRSGAAAYAVFIAMSTPFFVFHGTLPHLDIITACIFGLGFFFFLEFTRQGNERSLHSAIIFFTLTALSKYSSDTLTFIGMAFLLAALSAYMAKGGRVSAQKAILFILPPLIYFLLKKTAQPSSELMQTLEATVSATAPGEGFGHAPPWHALLPGIWYSLFSSGHFGVLFYALGMSIVIFFRKIFFSHYKWGLGLLMAVLGGMVMYYLVKFNDPLLQQSQISRAMLTPAVAAALFLASLWGDEAGQ